MSEQRYYVYELEATGCEAQNGADTIWWPKLNEAFDSAIEALSDLTGDFEEPNGKWSWSGSIKRLTVTWEQIDEVWDGNPPDRSKFEAVEAVASGEESR